MAIAVRLGLAAVVALGIGIALRPHARPAPAGLAAGPQAESPAPGLVEAPALAGRRQGGPAAPRVTGEESPPGGTSAQPVAPGSEAAESAPALVRVPLRLLRSDGGALDRASVRIAGEGAVAIPWDPTTESVELPQGTWSIEVLGGRAGEWRQPEDWSLKVYSGMPMVVVTLRPWRMILGRLRRAEGGPGVPAQVHLRSLGIDPNADDARSESERVEFRMATVGEFSFGLENELAPGTYEVTGSPWKYGPSLVRTVVEVRDVAAVVELEMPAFDRAAGVRLTVLDPEGRPRTPTSVTLDVVDALGGGGGGGATVDVVAEGELWIPTLLPGYSGNPPVRVILWLQDKDLGVLRVEVPSKGGPDPVIARFARPAGLEVSQIGAADAFDWAAGTFQLLRVAPGSRRLTARTQGPHANPANLGVVQPGDYLLTWERRRLVLSLGRVELHSGPNRFEASSPVLHPVTVVGAGATVYVRSVDPYGTQGFPEVQEGEPLRLPAGTYVLSSAGRGATVTVPTSSPVTLEETPRR